MLSNIILLLTVLWYSVIVSQSFSYIISIENVQRNFNAAEYIRFRHLTDQNYRKKFSWLFYGALISNTLLVVILWLESPGSALSVAAGISLLLLMADAVVTMKGNMPINNLINTWSEKEYSVNWKYYRHKWLQFFRIRQCFNITGFVILLISVVFF